MGFFSNIGKERRIMRSVDKMAKENGIMADQYRKERYLKDLETATSQEEKDLLRRAIDECDDRTRKNSR